MEPKIETICPRCEQVLERVDQGGREASIVLACPEPHCDYVLVLARAGLARVEPVDGGFAPFAIAG